MRFDQELSTRVAKEFRFGYGFVFSKFISKSHEFWKINGGMCKLIQTLTINKNYNFFLMHLKNQI